ncbi:ABC transporter substrate-binding protein [Comamonadaceae bacterium OH2545_COT-014]|nr:ABC transporter substrate-binding protein [Comamonadaceae bacterium OH2545_COT-014]
MPPRPDRPERISHRSPAAFAPTRRRAVASLAALAASACLPARAARAARADQTMRVGITLHPYFSFVSHIVGDRAQVLPLIDAGFNPHAYEPRAEDIKRIGQMDVVVLNAIGHDDFAKRMIAASDKPQVPTINANADVPLLSTMALGTPQGRAVNPHTFISISASMIQVSTIARELGKLAPAHAAFFSDNARAYNRRLRKLRADALAQVTQAPDASFRVATVHGAYDYLLREFGLEVSAVVEPAHGMEPSAAQLKSMVERMRAQNIRVLFAEQDNPGGFVQTLVRETGVRVYPLTHISHGPYTAGKFEQDMSHNLNTVVRAIQESRGPRA